jgi:hypothetical protein
MTELEAVNIALQTIGEMTVTTASNIADVYEASTALEILTETRRTVLTEGWNCNTDTNWTVTSDSNGYIALASTVLRVESSDGYPYIMKDNKLYDKENHTFLFTANSNYNLDIVWDLDFDDIPHSIAYYIAVRAARITYQRLIGGTDIIRVLMDDEQKAKEKMIEHDVDTRDYSIFDNSATRRIISRTQNPRGILG